MKNNMDRKKYLKSISGFIEYMVDVVRLNVGIAHGYYDRKLKEPLKFETLKDAFEQYHWDGGDYVVNESILECIQQLIRDAGSDKDMRHACHECLKWGAGGEGPALYRMNMKWINKAFPDGVGLKKNIDDASSVLMSRRPDLTDFGDKYRMNAGFTKIYSLYNDNFIIYDGRVGGALGYFVTRYGDANDLSLLPEGLRFPYGAAQGKQNRDPSIANTIYQFPQLSNHKQHALWNVRANWMLEEVMKQAGGFLGIKGQKALRSVEAALFMIGYDFPSKGNAASNSNQRVTKKSKNESAKNNKDGRVSLSKKVKKSVDTFIKGANNEFTPKQIEQFAKENNLNLTTAQVRSVLLRDSANAGKYYPGGSNYYIRVRRGVYKLK